MRSSPRLRNVLLPALSLACAAATLSAAPARADGPGAPPRLDWRPCAKAEGEVTDAHGPARECATLSVPLDYREAGGRRLGLAVSRLRSDHPDARRGTLLLIAGGPGGSGVGMLARRGTQLRQQTHGAYDIVSLDPRGTGGSPGADCGLSPADREITTFRPWPAADGSIGANVATARRIADACARDGGPVLRSLSTVNEVRDLDRFRQALGERRLSAYGLSYGTYVGAVYAQKYPQHTDRWVLDSNADPDPERVERAWVANFAVGAEDRFPDFAKWASDPARGTDRLARTPQEVRDRFLSLASQLDREPRRFDDTKKLLTGNALRQQMQLALYNDEQFPGFARLMAAAGDGGSAPLKVPDPQPKPMEQRDAAVFLGVVCNDVRWPRAVPGYVRAVAVDRVAHPLTAGMPANVMPCAFWKGGPVEKPVRITPDGPSNVLLLQGLRDPATPYSGALKMRAAFGDRARMVTVDAGGHAMYLANGNSCGDRAVTEFLVTGKRPEQDIACPAETR
ncbi:alpha/beta hydrolase [Streptomyces gamaensis]|uniref:Alpha/beta hydrolase n=1 Tax=Streptomyces gamaensis TaxID=1763542 RepID=A0ABW0YUA5_9ACTN